MRFIEQPAFDDLSVSAEGTELKLKGKIFGTTDRNVAEAFLLASTATDGLTNSGFVFRNSWNLNRTGYNQFQWEVSYGRKNIAGEYSWDFDTTGGTVHITQAKESIKRYYSGGSEDGSAAATNVPKHFGSLGVEKDEVKGTEIIIPAMKINLSFRHPLGTVTMAWAKMLSAMTGKVNSTTFLDWSAGEVLFLGGRGADGSQAEATVNYQFAMSKNVTGMSIGAIANVAKKGWEYLWISYKDEVSANTKSRPPEFVYVERVYDTEDFAGQLGFG